MTQHCWELLWRCIQWLKQPDRRPESMSHKRWHWRLVSDFVDCFNEHRATKFVPSDKICVDESMSKWYGLVGHWINMGLPIYVLMDCKPVNGCKIQNICCRYS